VGALFCFGVNDPATLLIDNGWRVLSVKHPGDTDANFGRWVQPPDVSAGIFFVMTERVLPPACHILPGSGVL
jgi:hypothetical protein